MSTVHLLWFVNEAIDGCELLIGVYSTEASAREAIERQKGKKGFVDFPQGFQIHPYELDRDHWLEGFIVD